MGNTCKNIAVEDEEIETGTGIYSFKKAMIPKSTEEKIFYSGSKHFDPKKIERNTSLVRRGVNEYPNGNVNVIIPVIS